nr:PREDICTED: Na(+)/H(+) exchange regulatory cofactor NHE-RF2-like [Apteryx mantelli mantelli]
MGGEKRLFCICVFEPERWGRWVLPARQGAGLSPASLSPLFFNQDLNGQKELCPRLCHLKKGPNGYGFNLHSEKSRPGQFIRSVDPDSPASKAGLRPQDRLVEVNGINVEGLRHSEVVSHIKSRENEARLLVVDPETDDYFKKLGVTPTEEHARGETGLPWAAGCRSHDSLAPASDAVALQVNGINVEGLRHSEVVSHIKSRENEARLLVVDPETDDYFKKLGVNGINVEGLRHSEVVSHIKSRENEARLLVVDPETDDYFKKLGVTPTEEHARGETGLPWAAGCRSHDSL